MVLDPQTKLLQADQVFNGLVYLETQDFDRSQETCHFGFGRRVYRSPLLFQYNSEDHTYQDQKHHTDKERKFAAQTGPQCVDKLHAALSSRRTRVRTFASDGSRR